MSLLARDNLGEKEEITSEKNKKISSSESSPEQLSQLERVIAVLL